ncbi:hypothetical protein PROFUN_16845 [Planoprotostelium fungivorum]|uniref:Uncharacterized protein n=1 Tax=Planoprotostelium fungivorum TaxID=1890364 RepID=A0A2P6MNS7_9EUKA|nr:hypothetical protein PROFUN_16845 [Planoprotostelium fungivorum]
MDTPVRVIKKRRSITAGPPSSSAVPVCSSDTPTVIKELSNAHINMVKSLQTQTPPNTNIRQVKRSHVGILLMSANYCPSYFYPPVAIPQCLCGVVPSETWVNLVFFR